MRSLETQCLKTLEILEIGRTKDDDGKRPVEQLLRTSGQDLGFGMFCLRLFLFLSIYRM